MVGSSRSHIERAKCARFHSSYSSLDRTNDEGIMQQLLEAQFSRMPGGAAAAQASGSAGEASSQAETGPQTRPRASHADGPTEPGQFRPAAMPSVSAYKRELLQVFATTIPCALYFVALHARLHRTLDACAVHML